MDANHTELRANAMLSELKAHINSLVDRCAMLAAENVVLQARMKELDQKDDPKAKKEQVN